MDDDAPTATQLEPDNPFAMPSPLPFELPPFAAVRTEHYAPAFRAGMAEQLVEVAAVVADPAPPTLQNTLIPLERSGQLLNRVSAVFENLLSSIGGPALESIEREWTPAMTAHADAIRLDPGLFARISALHRAGPDGLDGQDWFLIQRYHTDFVLAGAQLDDSGRALLREFNQQISALSVTFGQNVQAATEAAALMIDTVAELDGLTHDQIEAAAAAAAERGQPGRFALPLVLPTQQPALEVLTDRRVRERLYRASVDRASSGEFDNGPVLIELARVRARRAALLGFPNHAAAQIADETAHTTTAIDDMLGRIVGPAAANLRREQEVLAAVARQDGIELAGWDWSYYSEKVRAGQYSVDTAKLRPYFELERVLADGVFWAAGELYGITFRRREDLIGYHPDVRVYEVVETSDGRSIGLFLGDFYARAGKRGGAWMSSFVDQSGLLDSWPVIANNVNASRPAEGDPSLLTFDEVVTLFHEFGHALHGLFSAVRYPRFSGTNVPRDFVEFPSQVNEMWMLWPNVLGHYAFHFETGEPLPAETVAAIKAAELWGQGQATFEYLAATLLDQAWHRITPDQEISSAAEFEAQALTAAGLASELVPPRYRSNYFQHVFAGGYSAGYYAYIWSEVLDADTVQWFRENGGFSRRNGDVFRDRLLSVGGSRDPLEAFESVRGRPADMTPLLRRRGLDRTDA